MSIAKCKLQKHEPCRQRPLKPVTSADSRQSCPMEASTRKEIDESTPSGCMIPSPQDTQDPRFFNRTAQEALWITAKDAINFFNVDSRFLHLAKIMPLSKGSQKYLLYSVYACAQQFHTMTHLTTEQALTKFLEKNKCQHRT